MSLRSVREEKIVSAAIPAKAGSPASLTPLITWLIVALATGALISSSYLAWVSLTSSKVAGCDGGVFDCGHVLTTRWSTVFGIPVGVPAVGLYLLLLGSVTAAHVSVDRVRERAIELVWLLAVTASLSAVWFISLQVTLIGKLCPYCLLVHGCGIALAGLMLWRTRLRRDLALRLFSVAALLVGILIVGQVLSAAPQTYEIEEHAAPASRNREATDLFEAPVEFAAPGVTDSPIEVFEAPNLDAQSSLIDPTNTLAIVASLLRMNMAVLMSPQEAGQVEQATTARKLVPILGGSKSLDANQWPLWGNPNSSKIVVEMFDYTCSHCRNTHRAIRDASKQLGGDFAVIALPVPLHRNCNDAAESASPERAHACEIARIAVGVWLVDRGKFTAFHDWLFDQERTADQARAHAESLVGSEALRAQLAKPTASSYIARNVVLYKEAGRGTVPKIIFPTTTVVGEIASGGTLANMVREKL